MDDFIKREVTVNMIDSNNVNFLYSKETLKEWKRVLDFEDSKLVFKEKNKEIHLIKGSHFLVKLELVGR